MFDCHCVEKKIEFDVCSDWGFSKSMKTAISLPKDLFEKAECLAIKARSWLYGEGLREYVARHTPDEVTEALDRIIKDNGQPEQKFITSVSAQTLTPVKW